MLDAITKKQKTPYFAYILEDLREKRNMSRPELYKRADVDKAIYARILTNNHYIPRKRTIISLGIALELCIEEMEELLKSAGYMLSTSLEYDIAIRFCIENNMFDICEINALLESLNQPCLGTITRKIK
jgi:hypothetical protein